jgi:hypothetical protein
MSMLLRRPTLILLALLALLSAAACASSEPDRSAAAARPPAGRGVIVGTVALAAGETLPEYAAASTALRTLAPGRARDLPAGCPEPGSALRPVGLTAAGLLSGVLLAASDFSGELPHEPRIHDVSIRDCRLQPALVDATRGDRLRVRNHDAFAFAPSFGPAREEQPLARDTPVMIALGASGVETILCPLTAPCGRSDVVTFNHPLHARTDALGQYRIEGFPVGQRVRLSAWHPLFEESTTHVWLERGETRRVDLLLTPRKP